MNRLRVPYALQVVLVGVLLLAGSLCHYRIGKEIAQGVEYEIVWRRVELGLPYPWVLVTKVEVKGPLPEEQYQPVLQLHPPGIRIDLDRLAFAALPSFLLAIVLVELLPRFWSWLQVRRGQVPASTRSASKAE